jgi:glycosyltransferase involved in cell wall biosynthesis
MPLISVIIPGYNAEKYIDESLDSIRRQTYEHLEIIIINDGSSDKTLAIINAHALEDPRVKVHSFPERRGIVAALNHGIELSIGDWIARMDADDIAFNDRLSQQLDWVEKNNADICGAWIVPFNEEKNWPIEVYPVDDADIKKAMFVSCPFAHPTVIIRSTVIKSLRYGKSYDGAEDYDLWVRMAHRGLKMTNFPGPLLYYRIHKQQFTMKLTGEKKFMVASIRGRYWRLSGAPLKLITASFDPSLANNPPRSADHLFVDDLFRNSTKDVIRFFDLITSSASHQTKRLVKHFYCNQIIKNSKHIGNKEFGNILTQMFRRVSIFFFLRCIIKCIYLALVKERAPSSSP